MESTKRCTLITDTFVEKGDAVLLPEPTFDMYRFYAELAGARVIAVRYDDEMRFPLAGILRELRRVPRVLFLANPNNPTGTLAPPEALRQILRVAPRTLSATWTRHISTSRARPCFRGSASMRT